MFTSVKHVQDYCRENGIRMIDFKMIDIDGCWRHITIPAERMNEDTGEIRRWSDGSNYGYTPIEKRRHGIYS